MAEAQTILAEQFDDVVQQKEASTLGMWTFLATEIMFFGGLFLGYTVYRIAYPTAFGAGSHHSNLWLGTINTAVLLTSSLTMALAVHAAQTNRTRALMRFLGATIVMGIGFLIIKGVEYYQHYAEHLVPGVHYSIAGPAKTELFFYLYFAMTGLHAIHVLVGVGLLTVLLLLARARRFSSEYNTPVEVSGLYWHFVDLVWVFLYPLFYLVNRHG